jgi:hypothetical protein
MLGGPTRPDDLWSAARVGWVNSKQNPKMTTNVEIQGKRVTNPALITSPSKCSIPDAATAVQMLRELAAK